MTEEQFQGLVDLILATARAEASKAFEPASAEYYFQVAQDVCDRVKPLFVESE